MDSRIYIFRAFLIGLCVLALTFVLVPNLRQFARSLVNQNKREIISTLKSDLFKDGRIITIAKVKDNGWLYIEVYEQLVDGMQKSIDKIKLPDNNDGYFHLRGQATNLAIEDINQDGFKEILAPTYDANHVAHLNVYTYNPDTERFEVLQKNK